MEKFILLSERKHKFEIEGEIQGEKVKGEFECKYPSIMDTLEIDNETSRLIAGSSPATLSNRAYDLAYRVAFTSVLLTKKPKWYVFEIMDDGDIVRKVYDEVVKFITTFRAGNENLENTDNSVGHEDKKTVESK